ncbi:SWIM zinc finger family protein [Sporosarcina limicola]|uniref:SWIM-type domain-containing protein n=1 Tax=Sporosarcina limicola TaxID=34101 RepID=A0A927MIN0_9BACL|nr:SWIM zinc finger family protein [Sporosarcina limicola]MBE1555365.1 hypothetical protein [Sporosarcina limicola]
MNIRNFETRISEVILQRGQEYFKGGHVVELFEITDTNWQAEVEGTDTYVVDVKLNEVGEIIDSCCDCPYDSDSYCKHEVAVFYALQGMFNDTKRKSVKQKKPTLPQLLEAKKKEELIELILDLALNNTDIYKELLFEVSQQENEIDSAEALILHHISMAKTKGFIKWDRVPKALKGVDVTLGRVREKLEDSQYEMAIHLSLLCLKHSVELLNVMDHSSGETESGIDDSLASIEFAIGVGMGNWNHEEKEIIFAKIVDEALDKKFNSWSEYRFELLTACIHFCTEAKFEDELNAVLESFLGLASSESWNNKSEREKIKDIQFQMILQKKDTEAIERFLFDNLTNSNMREKAILYSFEKKEYEKALKLSIEGEQVDKSRPGIVKKWKNYEYESYQYLGDKKAMREIAFTMVLQGYSGYYEKIKCLYLENEWQEVVDELLLAFDEKKYYPIVYLTILIEENRNRRLLKYCQESHYSILSYYKYLLNDYFAEVTSIFEDYIREKAHAATNRKDYQQVCEIIRRFQQACGQSSAISLIDGLKKEYDRRPAFLDELRKV